MTRSDRVRRLPGYPLADVPALTRRLKATGVDLIDLGAGDNDTPPPAPVVEALQSAVLDPARSKYGFQLGLREFRDAIGRFMERRFQVTVDPIDEVALLLGSKEGLAHLPLAVLNPGEVAIIPEPGYQAYLGGTLLAGGEPVTVPLRREDNYLVHLDRLPADVLARTRLVFLNYPNNPTAAVAPRDYLERTVALCRDHGIVLAYDNAYCELTFDGYVAPSILEIPGARDVAIEFFSLSKSYSMTGWRLGWATGNRDLVAALTAVKTYVDTGPFPALQAAATVALDRSEDLVAPVRERLQRRRDAALAALRSEGFVLETPRAAMYLWVALPGGAGSEAFARRALLEEGVVVLPGAAFGPGGEGYFRIALTVDGPRLVEAIGRLGRVARSIAGAAHGTLV